MKNIIACICLVLCSFSTVIGQKNNLALNGSFEKVDAHLVPCNPCLGANSPEASRSLETFIWNVSSPNAGGPHLFYSGLPEDCQRNGGESIARTGKASIGLKPLILAGIYQRIYSYFQSELRRPLEEGKRYRVELWKKDLGQNLDQPLQVGFWKKKQNIENTECIENTSALTLSLDSVSNKGWHRYAGTYLARGEEKFLGIGLFEKNYEPNGSARDKPAYYAIDDVSVTESSSMIPTPLPAQLQELSSGYMEGGDENGQRMPYPSWEAENSDMKTDSVLSVGEVDIAAKPKLPHWKSYDRELYATLKYPKAGLKNKRNAVVEVSFIVKKTGELTGFQVKGEQGFGFAQAAIEAIKNGPEWKPAQREGKAVNTRVSKKIRFQLFK